MVSPVVRIAALAFASALAMLAASHPAQAASPAIFDTGAPSPDPLKSEALAERKGWAAMPETIRSSDS